MYSAFSIRKGTGSLERLGSYLESTPALLVPIGVMGWRIPSSRQVREGEGNLIARTRPTFSSRSRLAPCDRAIGDGRGPCSQSIVCLPVAHGRIDDSGPMFKDHTGDGSPGILKIIFIGDPRSISVLVELPETTERSPHNPAPPCPVKKAPAQ